MNGLLKEVLDAHGGLDRWSNARTLTVRLAIGGPFWQLRGFKDAFLDETLDIDIHRQHATFTPWAAAGQHLTFKPDRVTLKTDGGGTVAQLVQPRSSYAGYGVNSPWNALQVGYFLSYAMWNYLTTPYLLTFPGVQAREINPWQENGQTWRRLHVTFPDAIATHTAQQTFYYDDDGLLRRHDYTVDVNAGATAAHYTGQHQRFGGLVFPTRRRVYRRNPDNAADRSVTAITLDIHDITIA